MMAYDASHRKIREKKEVSREMRSVESYLVMREGAAEGGIDNWGEVVTR